MDDNKLLKSLDDPEGLERLYQDNKEQFRLWLDEGISKHPTSETLKVWYARLHHVSEQENHRNNSGVLLIVILCFLSGILAKLPTFLSIDNNWYYPRFIPLIIIGALIVYFFQRINLSHIKVGLIAGMSLSLLVLLALPDKPNSASIIMSLIHMPLVLASLLAVGFMGDKWMSADSRLSFIHYLGEVLIYSSIIILGGVVLTLLTLGLFNLIGFSIGAFYFEYIVVLGLISSPIVATHLYDNVMGRGSTIATMLSNVFSPLFLITISVYLLAVLYQGKTPYSDRGFLITFNGLLIVVWGITVFSISGIQNLSAAKISDKINVALVSVTLVINAIALSAIIFRLAEYGITPNRIAVTGANILIFIHLILILKAYVGYMKKHQSRHQLIKAIANYLPAYSVWSLFVVIALPIIFWFE